MLQEVFIELFGLEKTYYFDEIQNIENWKLFVRRLYNAGNKIYIIGSNATLFSEELGTRLTGRYLDVKIYPFSFSEFVQSQTPGFAIKKTYPPHKLPSCLIYSLNIVKNVLQRHKKMDWPVLCL